jgi:SAM-dependent methyltransferase
MGLRLNLGCGRSPLPGWVNVDIAALPGIDVVADLDACRTHPLPFADGSADEMRMTHVLEHIGDTLALMQELHRIAAPNAVLTIRTPYGSSDDAYEDPTHRHRFFMNSFGYFSQPFYWRADYGYRGDWEQTSLTLIVPRAGNAGLSADQLLQKVQQLRNVVLEMVAELRAVKPIRPADQALRATPTVNFQLV